MESIREYLLSVTAAAVLCSCVCAFFQKKSTVSNLVKTLCGIFLSLVVLRPIIHVSIPEISDLFPHISADAQAITAEAEQLATDKRCEVIKQHAQAYVYDKAAVLGCDITVDISLNTEEPYAPESVRITGKVSPYAKSQLSAWIKSDLGISEEEQHWNS